MVPLPQSSKGTFPANAEKSVKLLKIKPLRQFGFNRSKSGAWAISHYRLEFCRNLAQLVNW
jgi:hypothetical protein